MPQPTPDRSVRLAWVADVPAVAAVQGRAWRDLYAELLPDIVEIEDTELEASWATAVRRPPSGRHRVLVALDDGAVVGFAALAPSEDPDADPVADDELVALVVDRDHLGRGHGSRLLQAAADTALADRCSRLTTWAFADDEPMLAFVRSSGWAPDGAHRQVEVSSGVVRTQVRLHTGLGSAVASG